MAEKAVGIRLGVTGDQQSAAAIEAVGQRGASAFDRLRVTMQRAGTQADFAEGQFKKLNRGVGDAAGAVQLLATLVPGLDGNFGKLSAGIGNVADLFGTFSNLLLRNPIGLLATGVTAATAAFFYLRDGTAAATQSLADYEKAISTSNAILLTANEISRAAAQAKVDEAKAIGQATLAAEQQQQASLIRSRILIEQQRQQIIDANKGLPNFDASTVLRDPLAKVAREFDDVGKRIDELQTRLGKLNDPSQFGAARTERETRSAAIFESTRTAAERYAATLKELNELRSRDAISQETYNRAVVQAQEALDGANRGSAATVNTLDQVREKYQALAGALDPAVRSQQEYERGAATLIEAFRAQVIGANEFERMLALLSTRQIAGSEAGKAQASAVQATRSLYEASITPMERYQQQLEQIAEAEKSGQLAAEQTTRARVQAQQQLAAATEETKSAKNTARELGLAFTSAFENAVVGGKGLREVLAGLAQDIARLAIRKSLTEPLFDFFAGMMGGAGRSLGAGAGAGGLFAGLFGGLGRLFGVSDAVSYTGAFYGAGPADFLAAKGAAMSGGTVVPFASGGLVDRPTLFPMSGRRTGVMGEAGPEAIMPLRRTADGRLGVAAEGGGGGGVHLNVSTTVNLQGGNGSDDKDQRQIGQAVARQVREAVQNEIRQAMRPGGQLYAAR
jgi:phage-related minor tail protein